LSRSRKYPYPPQGGSLKIARGKEEVAKAITLKGKYEAKLKVPEEWGRGTQSKNPLWEGYGYFLEKSNYSGFCSMMQCDKYCYYWMGLPAYHKFSHSLVSGWLNNFLAPVISLDG